MTVGKTPIEDEFFADGLIKDVNVCMNISLNKLIYFT